MLCSASQSLSDQVQEHLRNRIEAAGIPPETVGGGEKILESVALPRFYTNHASDPKGTCEHIQSAIAENREQTVTIPEPLDVRLLYWTTWIENDGSVHFCKDIYKRDDRLREALDRKSPDTSDNH